MSLNNQQESLADSLRNAVDAVLAEVGQVWFLSDEDGLREVEPATLRVFLTASDLLCLLRVGQVGFDSEWCQSPGRLINAAVLAELDDELRSFGRADSEGEGGSHE